jgi:hypothetical protein
MKYYPIVRANGDWIDSDVDGSDARWVHNRPERGHNPPDARDLAVFLEANNGKQARGAAVGYKRKSAR